MSASMSDLGATIVPSQRTEDHENPPSGPVISNPILH